MSVSPNPLSMHGRQRVSTSFSSLRLGNPSFSSSPGRRGGEEKRREVQPPPLSQTLLPPPPLHALALPHILPLRSSRLHKQQPPLRPSDTTAKCGQERGSGHPPPTASSAGSSVLAERSDDDGKLRMTPTISGLLALTVGAEKDDESMRGGRRRQGPRSAQDRDWTLRHRCRHPQLRKGHRELLFVVHNPCQSPPFSCLLAGRHPLCISPSICYRQAPTHGTRPSPTSLRPSSPTVSSVATRCSLIYRRAPLVPRERRG